MEYVALGSIFAPGTPVAGYRRGDPVDESVVENWGLKVGEDVAEGELPAAVGTGRPLMLRPGPEDTRVTWEMWAVANGMSQADAEAATQEELEATGPGEPGRIVPVGDGRPADSAKKADWIAYAESLGAPTDWARADGTTKADLQAWRPGPADPIAESATEAQAG